MKGTKTRPGSVGGGFGGAKAATPGLFSGAAVNGTAVQSCCSPIAKSGLNSIAAVAA